MRPLGYWVLAVAVLYALCAATVCFAKKTFPWDSGPATIDVSKYPQQMKDTYTKLFSVKCKQCHTLARPINSTYVLQTEWDAYTKKMVRKPGAKISEAERRLIVGFLSYDAKVRKKALYDKKAAAAAGGA